MRPVLTVFADPVALGRALAVRIADEIEEAARAGRSYVLGCPGGRTPMTTYAELALIVTERQLDLRHLVIVMMDEYVTVDPGSGRFRGVDDRLLHSCRRFGRKQIVEPLSRAAGDRGIDSAHFWLPDPTAPSAYDQRIDEAGGIDLFILASGVSDGHVAFNPPGSRPDSVTRVVELAETTRRDNLATFPSLRTLDRVPRHGVSVGIDTIRRYSRSAVMLLHGASKATAAARVASADRYDTLWPATVLAECAAAELFVDQAAAGDITRLRSTPV
jgi:glucosamine-6-phosphate deaminase